ncbi:hypothetical protein EI969_03780 [Pseudomonas sp. PB101]|nr:hypothetical protein [Pseudomonas sp. PB101]
MAISRSIHEIRPTLGYIVGASLLAMVVNDDAYRLEKCVAFQLIASKLAPTGGGSRFESFTRSSYDPTAPRRDHRR